MGLSEKYDKFYQSDLWTEVLPEVTLQKRWPRDRMEAVIAYGGEGDRILDVGCGPGRVAIPIARHLAQQGGDVVAMDIQEEMLQRVREKALKENLTNIQFLQGDMERVNLEPERFDRALLVTVLGEIPDREAALREIFQALKPGGFLSVSEMIFDPHFQSRDTVARLGLSAGFREGHFYGNRFAFTLNLEKPQSSANT